MAKKFQTLIDKMPPEAQLKIKKGALKLLKKMPLSQLRQALLINQQYLADALDTKQANISRTERRKDMYISTLRNYIEGMGGELEIIAKFPQGSIRIDQFDKPKKQKSPSK